MIKKNKSTKNTNIKLSLMFLFQDKPKNFTFSLPNTKVKGYQNRKIFNYYRNHYQSWRFKYDNQKCIISSYKLPNSWIKNCIIIVDNSIQKLPSNRLILSIFFRKRCRTINLITKNAATNGIRQKNNSRSFRT